MNWYRFYQQDEEVSSLHVFTVLSWSVMNSVHLTMRGINQTHIKRSVKYGLMQPFLSPPITNSHPYVLAWTSVTVIGNICLFLVFWSWILATDRGCHFLCWHVIVLRQKLLMERKKALWEVRFLSCSWILHDCIGNRV